MKPIDYFKLQAKNLFRDFKTKTSYFDEEFNDSFYRYNPKYFDIGGLVLDFDINEDKFTLMNAQHLIAKLVGFPKWTVMENASEIEIDLAKLLFDNLHKINAEEWYYYITAIERDNDPPVDHEFRLEVFQTVFAEVDGHQSDHHDYRLQATKEEAVVIKKPAKKRKLKLDVQITSLPSSQKDRQKFIRTANKSFENVIERMEPEHPEMVRKLWNPGYYIDSYILPKIELPIDLDYALHLTDAFLVHHVLDLAIQADDLADNLN